MENNNNLGRLMLSHVMPVMKKASYEVALRGKLQIAEGTMAFDFEKPKDFHFNAGQHIKMTLINPPETDNKGNSRFLSLASSPQEKNLTFAMRMSDSAFKRVLSKMEDGEKVLIQILLDSPHGSFVIHSDASKPAVFVIGGIGIVPAFSMIKDAIERKLPHRIFLFYSNRRPEEAPYLEELKKLAKQNPAFKLIATVTKPEKSAKLWQGETGLINRAMLNKYLDDLQSPIYYIAGLTAMVRAMKKLLDESGVNDDNIHAEEFSGFIMDHNKILVSKKRNHLLLAVIGLMIVAAVVFHTGAASIFNSLSLKKFSYFTTGLIFIVVIFKVFIIFKFKHFIGFKRRK